MAAEYVLPFPEFLSKQAEADKHHSILHPNLLSPFRLICLHPISPSLRSTLNFNSSHFTSLHPTQCPPPKTPTSNPSTPPSSTNPLLTRNLSKKTSPEPFQRTSSSKSLNLMLLGYQLRRWGAVRRRRLRREGGGRMSCIMSFGLIRCMILRLDMCKVRRLSLLRCY